MSENEAKHVTEQAPKHASVDAETESAPPEQAAIEAKTEATIKKEWPKTREGTRRHAAQMIMIANEGTPMADVITLIEAGVPCSAAEARSHYVYQVKNGMAPGVFITTPREAADPMPAVIVRKLSRETHRALTARARRNRRSTEAEIRAILDGAVMPAEASGIGSALARLGRRFGGVELDIDRDPTRAQPISLE